MSTKKKMESKTNTFKDLVKQIKETDAFEIEVVRDLISEQIFNAMMVEKISKAEFARKLNTSPPYITKLLQGNGNFTIETLVKIAKALGYKFRPMLIPANQSWKSVVEYANSVRFQGQEQRHTQTGDFKSIKRVVDIDLVNSDIPIETVNNEQENHITS